MTRRGRRRRRRSPGRNVRRPRSVPRTFRRLGRTPVRERGADLTPRNSRVLLPLHSPRSRIARTLPFAVNCCRGRNARRRRDSQSNRLLRDLLAGLAREARPCTARRIRSSCILSRRHRARGGLRCPRANCPHGRSARALERHRRCRCALTLRDLTLRSAAACMRRLRAFPLPRHRRLLTSC